MKVIANVVVIDSTIWINLRKSGLINLIFRLPLIIQVSDFVVAEVTSEPEWEYLFSLGLQEIGLDEEELSHLGEIHENHKSTSLPDLASFWITKKNDGILLTGDDSLRKYAEDFIEVHGFLWIMDFLVEEKIMNPADAILILENLCQDPFVRLPDKECMRIIDKWKKMK